MAKEKLKLSLDQTSESGAQMTADEAKDLSKILASQAKAADDLTDEKKEGRVDMEVGDGRIAVSVSKVKREEEPPDDEN